MAKKARENRFSRWMNYLETANPEHHARLKDEQARAREELIKMRTERWFKKKTQHGAGPVRE